MLSIDGSLPPPTPRRPPRGAHMSPSRLPLLFMLVTVARVAQWTSIAWSRAGQTEIKSPRGFPGYRAPGPRPQSPQGLRWHSCSSAMACSLLVRQPEWPCPGKPWGKHAANAPCPLYSCPCPRGDPCLVGTPAACAAATLGSPATEEIGFWRVACL